MKKILLYSTLALGVGLCSCSQEDLGENPAQAGGQPVTVSVQLSDEVGGDGLSRALPTIPEGCVLRCILFVSDNDESTEDIRQEVIAENANDNITFSFTPPADTYTCSFWADYVKIDANSNGAYDDLYYNTTDLPNVTFADNADLFNNEACDAFTGHFDQTQIESGSVTLSRPLAKVNFVAKEDISGNVSVTSGYTVNNGMNISTGAINTTSTATLSCTDKPVADADKKILFFNYLFADGENTKLPTSISYTLGETSGTIPTNEIPLAANTPYNLSFSTTSGEVVTSPAVGDYFFTDGTWSSSLDESTDKTVAGVVFAVKGDGTSSAIESDEISNYSNAGEATDVLAWVIAANDVDGTKSFYSGTSASLPSGITGGAEDIKGYSNTALWYTQNATEYAAVAAAKVYDVTITGGENKYSGWYLPSAGQMLALADVYAKESEKAQGEALAVKTSLQALANLDSASGALMSSGFYWTSTGDVNAEAVRAYRVGFHETGNYKVSGANKNLTAGSNVRPVLTIFKQTE